ncbi:MAG: sulfotransferase [Chitinophagales bacterium]|nr:sulfotransferase [Chitinophagales bacterium]HAE14769.1 hypothetical protein [Bacteroidota bacterium]MCB9019058.1 sulfotransferase [Chitinophagales bacterium]MCB9022461.1 sulfotransferase [Chitinophagales bacterium]HAE34442.1 hypothetical protein [Bacteroidota bacterium]
MFWSSLPPQKAVFIVGYWNSGTTLLTDILRKHPDLHLARGRRLPNLEERSIEKLFLKAGTPFHQFGDYSEVLAHGFENYHSPHWNKDQTADFLRAFHRKFRTPKGKDLLLKNPWLFFYQEWIKETFTGYPVRKIMILRNGYSQVVSKDYWLRTEGEPASQLKARAIFWHKAMDRYFQTWHNDPDCLTIRYENLCSDPMAIVRQVCLHLNIDPNPLTPHLPDAFENRLTRWHQLEDGLKEMVHAEISAVQDRMDKIFPLRNPLT